MHYKKKKIKYPVDFDRNRFPHMLQVIARLILMAFQRLTCQNKYRPRTDISALKKYFQENKIILPEKGGFRLK
jgi:hypothetical protein